MTSASTTHTAFLKAIQEWIWKRFPTRQLSATDIFYALQWADSGLPVSFFIDGFEKWLSTHPKEFVNDCRLSSLQFEAKRIIFSHKKKHPMPPETVVEVDDPYEIALNRIASIGKETDNPLLKTALRSFYQSMLESRKLAQSAYPDWHARSESFYPLKARAIVDWNTAFDHFLDECFGFLAQQEKDKLLMLSPAEQAHCIIISVQAQETYKKQILKKKIAIYFNVTELLFFPS